MQQVNKFPFIYEIRMFIYVFTNASQSNSDVKTLGNVRQQCLENLKLWFRTRFIKSRTAACKN
jgi:hypothetical protein